MRKVLGVYSSPRPHWVGDGFPVVELTDRSGSLRVIAGQLGKIKGPARTFTSINLWDVRRKQNGNTTLNIPEGHTAMLVVLSGSITINNDKQATEAQLVLLNREGDDVRIEAVNDASFLLLSGDPIDEPVVMHGPFVMNTTQEISAALHDHQSGLFQTVGDMPMTELRARATAQAKIATLAKIPVITTASVPQGSNGPLIPEIHESASHAQYIARKGEINAWGNPEFVAALKATGRKTLIFPHYQLLMGSYAKAQDVATDHKVLHSMRK